LASKLINTALTGSKNAFETIEAVASVTLADVTDCLKRRFDTENCTLSVIRPIEK